MLLQKLSKSKQPHLRLVPLHEASSFVLSRRTCAPSCPKISMVVRGSAGGLKVEMVSQYCRCSENLQRFCLESSDKCLKVSGLELEAEILVFKLMCNFRGLQFAFVCELMM